MNSNNSVVPFYSEEKAMEEQADLQVDLEKDGKSLMKNLNSDQAANRNVCINSWEIFYVDDGENERADQRMDSYQVYISNSLKYLNGASIENLRRVNIVNPHIFIENLNKMCEYESDNGRFSYFDVTDFSPLHLAILLEYPDVVRYLCRFEASTASGMPSNMNAPCKLERTYCSFEKLPENNRSFLLKNLSRLHLQILCSGGDSGHLAVPDGINCRPGPSSKNCISWQGAGLAAGEDCSPGLSLEIDCMDILLSSKKKVYSSWLGSIWKFTTEERAGLIFLLYFIGPFVAATIIVPAPSRGNVLSGQLLSVMIIMGVVLFGMVQLVLEPLIYCFRTGLKVSFLSICFSILHLALFIPIVLCKLIFSLIIMIFMLIHMPCKLMNCAFLSKLFKFDLGFSWSSVKCWLPTLCKCGAGYKSQWQWTKNTHDHYEQAPIHTAFKIRNSGRSFEIIQILVEMASELDFECPLKHAVDSNGACSAKKLTTEEVQRSPKTEQLFLAEEINKIVWTIWHRDSDQEHFKILIMAEVAKNLQDYDMHTLRSEFSESISLRTNLIDHKGSVLYWTKTHFFACFIEVCDNPTISRKSEFSKDISSSRYLKCFSNYLVGQIAIQRTELEAAKFFLRVFRYVCSQQSYYEDKSCLFKVQNFLQLPVSKWISVCLGRQVRDHPAQVIKILETLFIPQLNLSRFRETNLFPNTFDPYSTSINDVLVHGSANLWCKQAAAAYAGSFAPIWNTSKLLRAWSWDWWFPFRRKAGLRLGKRAVVAHVIPLPGFCRLGILKPLVTHAGVEIFQTTAMRAATDVLWNRLKLKVCFLFLLYLVLVILYSGFAVYCLGAGLDIKTFAGNITISNSSIFYMNSTFFQESNETLSTRSNISLNVRKNYSYVGWKNLSVLSALNITVSKSSNHSLHGSNSSFLVDVSPGLLPTTSNQNAISNSSTQMNDKNVNDVNSVSGLSIHSPQNTTMKINETGRYSQAVATSNNSVGLKVGTKERDITLYPQNGTIQTSTLDITVPNSNSTWLNLKSQSPHNGTQRSTSASYMLNQSYASISNHTLSKENFEEIQSYDSYLFNQTINKAVNFTVETLINQTVFQIVNHTLQKSVNKSLSALVNFTQNSTTIQKYQLDLNAAWAFFISLFAAQVLNAFFLLRAVVHISKTPSGAYRYLFSEPWSLIMLVTQSMVTASLTMFAVGVSNEDLRLMSSVTILLLWICLLNYLKYFEAVSFLVELLVAITYEVLPFFVVVGTVMVGFTIAYIVVLKKSENTSQYFNGANSTVSDVSYEFVPVIFNLVQISEGRLAYDGLNLSLDYSKTTTAFAECMFIFLTVAITIVCLSALISIMNSTYEKVMENQSALRHRQKMLLCLDEMEMMWDGERRSFEMDMEWIYILSPSSDRRNVDKGLDLWEGKYGHRWSGHLQSMKRELDHRMNSLGDKLEKVLHPDRQGIQKDPSSMQASVAKFGKDSHSSSTLHQPDSRNSDAAAELVNVLHLQLFEDAGRHEKLEYDTWLE